LSANDTNLAISQWYSGSLNFIDEIASLGQYFSVYPVMIGGFN
jgi:hypothetical protein